MRITGDGLSKQAHISEMRVSERIGSTPRSLSFADGSICESGDNDVIDQWLDQLGAQSAEHRVFRLERRWQYALLALLATVLGSWAFIRFALPAMADRAAQALPRSLDTAIGEGGLGSLDAMFFADSALSMAQQAHLRAQFEGMRRDMDLGLDLRLELRRGGVVGANAFALPSGIVVVTDELVGIAEHREEIESVLAHEIGHVVHRHSLRLLLRSSASTLLLFTLLGDISSVSTLAASVPTILVQAKYSRDFEREADDFSYAWLDNRGIPRHRLADLLERMEKEQGGGVAEDEGVMSYFSSHPSTQERARR